ncbi:MAG: type VI secretion system-associated FHA domain protein TagH [Acetobacteraceae bacterium]
MPLTLTIVGGRGAGARATRSLRLGTLSIGRAAGNDWILPDPERHLSKTHCMITAADGRYLLTDVSTNGVFVNGATTRVPRDGQVELTDGDEIRFGEYVLTVAEAAAPSDRPLAGHSALAPGGMRRADPLAGPADATPDPLGGADALLDPFAAPAGAGFVHPIAAPPPALRASDPFDVADESHRGATATPDDDLFRGITPLDNWKGASQPDNVDAPMQAFAAPAPIAVSNFDDLDIDALLGDVPPAPIAPSPAGFSAAPAAPQAATPRPLFPVPPVVPPPATLAAQPADPFAEPPAVARQPAAPIAVASAAVDPVAAAPGPTPAGPAPALSVTDAGRLLSAFLDGAGSAGLALGPDVEAALRSAGTVFRVLVEGLRQVLMSRAAIKNEFRVEQTMLRARDNNALKFAVTTEDAIAALLQPSRPGYKPPLDSAREAFDDVRAHEMAVMAGVQTALLGLLKRFEPAALEKRLQPGMLGNLVPGARKARTWELFCTTYKDIAREAEDDFQSVFGREFARAYDAQIRKL